MSVGDVHDTHGSRIGIESIGRSEGKKTPEHPSPNEPEMHQSGTTMSTAKAVLLIVACTAAMTINVSPYFVKNLLNSWTLFRYGGLSPQITLQSLWRCLQLVASWASRSTTFSGWCLAILSAPYVSHFWFARLQSDSVYIPHRDASSSS